MKQNKCASSYEYKFASTFNQILLVITFLFFFSKEIENTHLTLKNILFIKIFTNISTCKNT